MRGRLRPPATSRARLPRSRAAACATGFAAALAAATLGPEPAAAAAATAAADRLPPATAAVIDYQRVFKDAKAARAIGDQVDARRQLYQDEIAREEQRLHEADKELAQQRSVLSPEAYAEKRRAFERRVGEVQRMVQERRRQLDQAKAMALNEVRAAMIEIVGRLADARGFNLVLPTSGVLLFAPQIDLTEEVIARLDAELPNVKVPERVD